MLKRRRLLGGIFSILLSAAISIPAFGAVYKRTNERYPDGQFMIIFESEGNGAYALGVDEDEWILRPLYDISAVTNDDPNFLFSFEESPGDKKWANNERLWELNHSMAIKSASGYLTFDSRGMDFFHAVPQITDFPEYRWQYIEKEDSDKGNYLKFKGSYDTAGKTGAIWAKANAEKTVLMLTTCGKGSDVYLYQETEDEAVPADSGGWQEYVNGYKYYGWKYINADGSLKKNEWYTEDDKRYYFGFDGVTLIGYNRLPDDKYYYFCPDASLLVNSEISIDNIPYRIGADGVCRKVRDGDPTRTSIKILQTTQDDEVLNWINIKRSELGLGPLYRDNRLTAIAEKVSDQDGRFMDGTTLQKLGTQQGIAFSRLGSLRINWNKNMKKLTLDHYYDAGILKRVVDDPVLNHIGIYSKERLAGSTRDVIIVVGAY